MVALLVVNWALMGYLMLRNLGPRPLLGFLAGFVGLVMMFAAAGQLRAMRLAEREPLVRWSDKAVAFRRYSSADMYGVPWSGLGAWRLSGERVVFDGEGVERDLGLNGLSEADREHLLALLREHLGPAASG